MTQRPLAPGLYERLVTRELVEALDRLDAHGLDHELASLDPGDARVTLARHLQGLVTRALRGDLARQVEVCNDLVGLLERHFPKEVGGGQIVPPARTLRSVSPAGLLASAPPPRPGTPLSTSSLITNSPGEPSLGAELRKELQSADRVDLICAFIRWAGVRMLESALKGLGERGVPLRVLTTTYCGATQQRALEHLASLGADIRIAYETKTTRLHAKAWLFHRDSGYSTAFVGSSNLSQSAMLDGLEWNVRLSHAETPHLVQKFRATFDSYWEERELFQPYDPERDRERVQRALSGERRTITPSFAKLDLRPFDYQSEILRRLQVERDRHNRWRNLVVAATGTGKTVMAAFDYKRLLRDYGDLKLLFVAHRKELLEQSLMTFRAILRDGSFGELYVAGERPDVWHHVFASVQSLASADLPPDHFDVVIVDEFHHAAAPTYRRLLDTLTPQVLLGLTATPERTDGQDVLGWFGGRVAAELRLWEALERQLLSPFQYFGVADNTDLRHLTWRRGGYPPEELTNLYTADDARVRLVLKALSDRVHDVGAMRAIGFCVSVAHAEFMARRFRDSDIPALAVTGETPADLRDDALRRLSRREVHIIFTVDLYNEGVDVPQVDTLLLLRPTQSATLFLQQLGRGLRLADGKECCTVLDFIGQQHRRFRFDLRYRALTGATRRGVTDAIESGFPFLPPGCHLELDRVAQRIILDNVRHALPTTRKALAAELRDLATRHEGDVDLATFLTETGMEPEDLYRNSTWSWSALRRQAGLPTPPPGPREDKLAGAAARCLHIDDAERSRFYREHLTRPAAPTVDGLPDRERRLLTMLHFTLRGADKRWPSLQHALDDLWAHPAVLTELRELLTLLDERSTSSPTATSLPLPRVLYVHACYTRDEILAAFDALDIAKPGNLQAGVYYDKRTRTDVFLVTLHKTETHFSPTTRYADYAISPRLFHWESQNSTRPESPTGQRYIHHRERGTHVLLFARERQKDDRGMTLPYVFLGPARYVSHEGSRPIAFTWELDHEMPFEFFEEGRVVAG